MFLGEVTESRDERYARQTKEQFEELGRFVQAFEQLVSRIRTSCLLLLPGRVADDQILLNVVLHHRAFTAQPLFECMRALYAEHVRKLADKISQDEQATITGVLRQAAHDMSFLVERRNALLHGTWHIGFANPADQDFSNPTFMKGKVTGSGLDFNPVVESADDLRELRKRCDELGSFIFRLIGSFVHPEGPRVRFNFALERRRWVEVLSG